ncbi:MAG: WD40 repeat domain-containing protein, partial [Planctomycetota bacterium]
MIKVISGDQPDPAVLSHLETCATCRDHVESISEDMKSIATGYLQRQQKMKDLEQEAKEVLSFLNPNKPEIPFPAQSSPITWPFHAGTGIILMLVFGIALSWIVSTSPLSDENANSSPDDYTLAFLNSEIHTTVESPSDVPDSIGITSIWPTDVSAFSWHPKIKNRFVVGSINGEVRVVEFDDAGKFDNKDIYYGASTTVTRLSWSPDGQQLAVGEGSGAIRIWEYGKCRLLTEHNQLIRGLDFSPNGRYLFSLDYGGLVLIRQVKDWEVIRRYQISANDRDEPDVIKTEPFAIGARGKWTPDSKFVFASGGDFSDLLVRLSLDGESDLVIQDHQNSRLTSQENGIVAIDFETVSQKWLTVKPRKETIEIRDLSDPLAIQKSISVKGIKRAYFADNQLLWVERDDSIIKIDEEGKVLSELKDASLVSFSRDHRLLSVSRSQFNIQLGFYNESCQRIAAMPDTKLTNFIDADQIGDRLISLDSRKTVRLWDLQGNHLKSQSLDSIPIRMAKHPSG